MVYPQITRIAQINAARRRLKMADLLRLFIPICVIGEICGYLLPKRITAEKILTHVTNSIV